jgi:membrane carboxypeptidase/penicillin-binding protein
VSYRECVDILIKQYNDELKTFFDEEFEGEVYIKIMDDYDKYSSDYYYYVSVVGRGGSSINMIISPETGKILAIGNGRNIGSRTTSNADQYNYATEIKRQPGSTAKPLFDFGPGIEYNNFCESTPFNDNTYTYSSGAALKNWDGGYQGVITLKKALAESRNIPAVKAFQAVDNSKIKEFVTNLGMTPEIDSEGNLHEAHALGAFTGTNPVQLAGAYAAFGNGGYFTNEGAAANVDPDHFDLIYASENAQVEINGGEFKCQTPRWTLNIKDKNRTTASIIVKGGKFHGFNPANCDVEGEGTNFVAPGYKVVEENGIFEVIPE